MARCVPGATRYLPGGVDRNLKICSRLLITGLDDIKLSGELHRYTPARTYPSDSEARPVGSDKRCREGTKIASELMERQIRHCELPVRNDNVEGAHFASDRGPPPTVSSRPSSEGSSGVKTPRTKRRRPITSENVRYRCEPRQIPAKGRKTRTSNSEARRVGSRKGW